MSLGAWGAADLIDNVDHSNPPLSMHKLRKESNLKILMMVKLAKETQCLFCRMLTPDERTMLVQYCRRKMHGSSLLINVPNSSSSSCWHVTIQRGARRLRGARRQDYSPGSHTCSLRSGDRCRRQRRDGRAGPWLLRQVTVLEHLRIMQPVAAATAAALSMSRPSVLGIVRVIVWVNPRICGIVWRVLLLLHPSSSAEVINLIHVLLGIASRGVAIERVWQGIMSRLMEVCSGDGASSWGSSISGSSSHGRAGMRTDPSNSMLSRRSRWPSPVRCSERRKIAVGPSPIDHRRRVLASSRCRVRILKCHEAIAFGSAGVLVGNDNCFEDVSELLEVPEHGVALGLPSEAADEDLGEGRVAVEVLGIGVATGMERPCMGASHWWRVELAEQSRAWWQKKREESRQNTCRWLYKKLGEQKRDCGPM